MNDKIGPCTIGVQPNPEKWLVNLLMGCFTSGYLKGFEDRALGIYNSRLPAQDYVGSMHSIITDHEAENERLREVLLSLLADDSTCFGGAVEWYKRTDAAKAILSREQEKP